MAYTNKGKKEFRFVNEGNKGQRPAYTRPMEGNKRKKMAPGGVVDKDGDTRNRGPKPVRVKSKCSYSRQCGGCQYLDMDYKLQLQNKHKELHKLLGEFGRVEAIEGMENPLYYRNKVHGVFKRYKDGRIVAGTYEEGTHNVLPIDNCFIENKRAQEIIKVIADLLKSFKITIYNEDSGYGLMRHVLVRTGHTSKQIMVVLVTAGPVFPSKNNFAKALIKACPDVTTIVQNINEKVTSMVLGNRDVVMYGKGYIEDELCGKTFKISPQSFYQVNSVQTELLYNKAIKWADLSKEDVVLDAYCGIGTIGIIASDNAKEVIGVELNKDAVSDAKRNAKRNNISNITFYNNDAGVFMRELSLSDDKVDVVFMDPPRSGSDEAFLSSVMRLSPSKVIYISCGPESLARDLKYLTKKGGYQVKRIGAVDMFPMTGHVETVTCLHRVNS